MVQTMLKMSLQVLQWMTLKCKCFLCISHSLTYVFCIGECDRHRLPKQIHPQVCVPMVQLLALVPVSISRRLL